MIHSCLLFALLLANPLPENAIAQPEGLAVDFEPGLVDVNGLYIVVEVRRYPTLDPNGSELSSRLEKLIGTRLEEAAIRVVDQTDDPLGSAARTILARRADVDPNSLQWRRADVPVLLVAVDVLSSKEESPVALYTQTSFSRLVRLDGRNGRSFKAMVWSTDPEMEAVSSSSWYEQVQKVVLRQVESFIAARKAAAPHDGEAPVLLDAPALPKNAAGASQAPFVGSKNSSVFHRSDCRLTKTISEKNLVTYQSREEAIAAGKRPCKSCNP
jgi:hypothetical protein